ncbi:MAG: hypothetical protein ACR2M1_12030, partial [Gemmatimonadaceae bacterium]
REGGHLVAGFTPDFTERADGLPGLGQAYGLPLREVRPLAPAVKYQALAASAIDVVDGVLALVERTLTPTFRLRMR